MKSMKNYEFIDEILEFYIANNLTEREQRILKNITSNNK
ncbi:Rep63C (plasmid) [Bacillus cereus NVH0597-99]|nr:Rep63C [Bacillus cereus NVH0597-99]EEK64588.1 Rep63C [Bacillus wiedmannii]